MDWPGIDLGPKLSYHVVGDRQQKGKWWRKPSKSSLCHDPPNYTAGYHNSFQWSAVTPCQQGTLHCLRQGQSCENFSSTVAGGTLVYVPLDPLTVHSQPTVITAWLVWLRTALNSATGPDMSVHGPKLLLALCSGVLNDKIQRVLSYNIQRALTLYRGYLVTLYMGYLVTICRGYLVTLHRGYLVNTIQGVFSYTIQRVLS